jgi:Uma2 family endonuclease
MGDALPPRYPAQSGVTAEIFKTMAEPALRPMEIAEFLRWDGEGDTRYQLRDGVPVAMAPPSAAHSRLCGNLSVDLGVALKRRPPCGVFVEAGLLSPTRSRTYHQADIAVSCAEQRLGEGVVADPIVVVEVLSPTTGNDDRRSKLFDYRAMPSVREVVLIDSQSVYCEVHRRQADGRWVADLLRDGDAVLRLDSIGFEAALGELYRNVPLEAA